MYLTFTAPCVITGSEGQGYVANDFDFSESEDFDITYSDLTGEEMERHDRVDTDTWHGYSVCSIPLNTVPGLAMARETLASYPEVARRIQSHHLHPKAPFTFRVYVQDIVNCDDTEAAQAEADETQHAAEHLAWQHDQHDKP